MNIKQRIKELKQKLIVVFLAYKRKDTPLIAKVFAGITVIYALSPIDLIPDFIPVLGYLDDIIILPLLIALSIKLIPPNIIAICEMEAEKLQMEWTIKKWYYAIPFVAFWIIIIGVVVYRFFY